MDGQTAAVSIFLPVIVGLGLWLMRRRSAPENLPPGPPSIPILGSLPFAGLTDRNLHLGFLRLAKKYGDIFHLWTGNKLTVVLNNYPLIRKALLDNAVAMAGRPYLDLPGYNVRKLGIIEGSYTQKWKHDRNVSLSILKEFGFGKTLIEDRIVNEVEQLLRGLDKHHNEDFDPHRILQASVSNVICSIVLGKHFNHEDEKFVRLAVTTEAFMGAYLDVGDSGFVPILRLLPSVKKSFNTFRDTTNEIKSTLIEFITEHKLGHVKGDTSDFIHAYLDKMEDADDDEESLLYIVKDLFVAGTETTSTVLSWALLYMANYPDVQKKVQEELDSVLTSGRLPSLNDKANLPYTEAVVQEIQRLAATAPIGVAHQTLEDVTIDGYVIPKETMVLCNLWAVLRDPALWPEPDKLKPGRFLTEDGKALHRSELIPFSLGRRSCLGETMARQQLFLFFAAILQNYNICRPDGVDRIDETGKILFNRMPNDYKVVITKRHASA